MCKCLAPNAFASLDLEGLLMKLTTANRNDGGIADPEMAGEGWWSGDVNALFVCTALALLWSG